MVRNSSVKRAMKRSHQRDKRTQIPTMVLKPLDLAEARGSAWLSRNREAKAGLACGLLLRQRHCRHRRRSKMQQRRQDESGMAVECAERARVLLLGNMPGFSRGGGVTDRRMTNRKKRQVRSGRQAGGAERTRRQLDIKTKNGECRNKMIPPQSLHPKTAGKRLQYVCKIAHDISPRARYAIKSGDDS